MEAWREAGWLQGDREGSPWKEEWGYLGMVPKSVRPPECVASNQLHAFKKCTKLTAWCLLEMSQACWKARHAQVVEKGGWEGSVWITEAKTKKKRTGWTVWTVIGPKLKKGRPRLEDKDLKSEAYRENRTRKEKRARLVQEKGSLRGRGGNCIQMAEAGQG